MIVAYALPIIEKCIPSTYREIKISSESERWKNAMLEEMKSLHKNDTWERSGYPKARRPLAASEYLQRNKNLKMVKLFATISD